MIKGWKNNPAWVAYYEAKQEARILKEIEALKTQFLLADMRAKTDSQLRELDRLTPSGRFSSHITGE